MSHVAHVTCSTHVTPGPRLRSCPVVRVSKMGEVHVTCHRSQVTGHTSHVTSHTSKTTRHLLAHERLGDEDGEDAGVNEHAAQAWYHPLRDV